MQYPQRAQSMAAGVGRDALPRVRRSRFRRFFLPLLRTSACPLASVFFAFAPSLDVWRRIALERDPTVWRRIALERDPTVWRRIS